MNVSNYITEDYVQMDTWCNGKNKPNSNPIQSQFKPNSNPKQTQYKAKQTQFQSPNLLIDRMKQNYLSIALFPLTSGLAGHYNGIFSILYISGEIQLKGVGNE